MITDSPTKRSQYLSKRYHSDKNFVEFLPTRWRQKSAGIDMEQNCVTSVAPDVFPRNLSGLFYGTRSTGEL